MVTITLPEVPPSLNKWSRMHWMKAAKVKKQWEKDIYYSAYNLRPEQPYQKAKVKITYFFKTKRRRDIDNYTPKFLLDGLVKAGIIIDDAESVIGKPDIFFDYSNEEKTIIEVRSEDDEN